MSLVFSAPPSISPLAFLAQLFPIHYQEPLTHILATAATASTATYTGWELSKHLEHKSVCKLPPPPPQPPGFWELKSQKALMSYLLPRLPLEYKEKCPQNSSKKPAGTTKPGKLFRWESLLKGSLTSQDFLSCWWVCICSQSWRVGKPDTQVTTHHRAGQAQRWYYLHSLSKNMFFSSQPTPQGVCRSALRVVSRAHVHLSASTGQRQRKPSALSLLILSYAVGNGQQRPCNRWPPPPSPAQNNWKEKVPPERLTDHQNHDLLASSSNNSDSQPDLHAPTAYSS